MRLDRQLVHMLVAAIVLIAAYLVPSAAEAHAGHRHPEPAAVIAVEIGLTKSQLADHTTTLAETEAEVAALPSAADPSSPAKSKGCNGVCCSLGMACCAHALLAETGGVVPQRTAVRLGPMPDLLARPGVDPEALPKPPRPLA